MKEETETELFHILIHSSDGFNSEGWERFKSGARNLILVVHMGGGARSTWAAHPTCHKQWLKVLCYNICPTINAF